MQIDQIYYDIAPDYTAFYSTEAGVVSLVQSEFVTPVPVVTPIYTPALIWFVVLCILLVGSAVMYFRAYSKLKKSTPSNLIDNVYISDTISTPFVFGTIRPKIYLPKGLTEQQQNYVITHEKVHIKRGDHIIKLFAFVITCVHWFNPLVWLGFFLLERDMEMSCDEKVLQILGNEHKKDYSYCILSLASDRKFVPKAYLSFGDSDTKKRIKNVLDYKKPAVVASVMTIIGIAVIAVGMLADSGVAYVPDAESIGNKVHQINFPVYDQRTEYNSEIFDRKFSLVMQLPAGWSVEIPAKEDTKYPLIGVWNRMGIYNENNELVGAVGYNIFDQNQSEPMAIYNQVALGNGYQFAVGGKDYTSVVASDNYKVSTVPVYYSSAIAQQTGFDGEEVVNHGILCHNSEKGIYVAVELDRNAVSEEDVNNIAHSVFIGDDVVSDSLPAGVKNDATYSYYNFTIEDISVTARFKLPSAWSFKPRDVQYNEYAEYICLDDDLMFVYDIYDDKNRNIGGFTVNLYTETEYYEDDPMAIYGGAIGLANMYNFMVKSEAYTPVVTTNSGVTAITDVYHAPQLENPGYTEPSVYHKGILCYNKNLLTHIAFEIDRDAATDELLMDIAESISLLRLDTLHATKMEIAQLATDNDVVDMLYALAREYNYSYADMEKLYVNTPWDYINCESRIGGNTEHIKTVFDMFISGKSESEINQFAKDKLLANGFTEKTLKTLTHLSFTPIELYYMTDTKAEEFVNRMLDPNTDSEYVVNRWDLYLKCAKESTDDKYVITYCNEKIVCSTGLLSFDCTNDFDITVHLLSTGNGEITVDIPAGITAAVSLPPVKTEYTVGIHADVAAETDINLIVREVKTE